MTPEAPYTSIGDGLPGTVLSHLFGKPCLKTNGKAFVCFFENQMVFKLTGDHHAEALRLNGSKLFDPSGKGRAMKALMIIGFSLFLLTACRTTSSTKNFAFSKQKFKQTYVDQRDNTTYGIVEVGDNIWFAENLNFTTSNSVCFDRKVKHCIANGRLYPHDELDIACPKGWRVPNIADWQILKSTFQQDSIYALLDTIHWKNPVNHSNESGVSFSGSGYQMDKNLFIGTNTAPSIWLNQFNKFDEYYHVHLYGGRGIQFEKSGYMTNEVFHAHPIQNLEHRRFSIRCVCDKKDKH